jgi:ketosteroid isomerase-like protein
VILAPGDRAAIAEVVAKYGVHLDRREFDRLGEVFTDDVVLEYDLVGERRGLAGATAFFRDALTGLDASQHLMHTTLVAADEDGATGFVQVTAHHAAGPLPAPPERVYTVTGTYTDRYVRVDAGWRIAHRRLTLITTLGDPAVLGL